MHTLYNSFEELLSQSDLQMWDPGFDDLRNALSPGVDLIVVADWNVICPGLDLWSKGTELPDLEPFGISLGASDESGQAPHQVLLRSLGLTP